jgi:hypothetical protein
MAQRVLTASEPARSGAGVPARQGRFTNRPSAWLCHAPFGLVGHASLPVDDASASLFVPQSRDGPWLCRRPPMSSGQRWRQKRRPRTGEDAHPCRSRTALVPGCLRGPAFEPVSFRGTILLSFRPTERQRGKRRNLNGGEAEQGPSGIPAEFVRARILQLLVRRFFEQRADSCPSS